MSRSAEHALDHAEEFVPVFVAPTTGTCQIAQALCRAQLEMQNPAFDMVNPHFKNKYASLAAVRDAVIPVLAKHGIALVQELISAESQVGVTTHLYHTSGQTLTFGALFLPVTKQDAQGYGSASTYARRYALMSVAGVVGEPDDDANNAAGKPADAQPLPPPAGFDAWWDDMVAAHTDGLKALEAVWKAAPANCAQWAAKNRKAAVDALKAAAAKVKA